MRPGLPALMVLATLAAPGCGIKSTVHLVAAQHAVQRAADRGALDNAAYEYTLAVRYLEKAREESAHARYGDAITLARQAEEFADKAVIVMQEKGLGAAATEPQPEPQPEPVPEAEAQPEAPESLPAPTPSPEATTAPTPSPAGTTP